MNITTILEYLYIPLFFAIPVLIVVFTAWPYRIKFYLLRFIIAVVGAFIFMETYYHAFIRPIAFNKAQAQGDFMYDGTGAGAANFISSIFIATVVSALFLVGELLIRRRLEHSYDSE